jgi:hypothetical protein
MASDRTQDRRVKVTAEAIMEITDEAALEQATLDAIDSTEFLVNEGSTVGEVRAEQRDEVRSDSVAAVRWLADPSSLVQDLPGIQFVEGSHTVIEVDEDGLPRSLGLDFAALFSLCQCDKESCDACSGYQMTPRTAAMLWTVGQVLADEAYGDIEEYGDEPICEAQAWAVFDEYPRITWQQNAVWRRQAARAFDDLTADLAAGKWPLPRCPGEEMALHLMLERAKLAVDDESADLSSMLARFPERSEDFDLDLHDVLFLDLDILELFDPEVDGIEDPDSDGNRMRSMGDYRPQAWFEPFQHIDARDGRRPFRR